MASGTETQAQPARLKRRPHCIRVIAKEGEEDGQGTRGTPTVSPPVTSYHQLNSPLFSEANWAFFTPRPRCHRVPILSPSTGTCRELIPQPPAGVPGWAMLARLARAWAGHKPPAGIPSHRRSEEDPRGRLHTQASRKPSPASSIAVLRSGFHLRSVASRQIYCKTFILISGSYLFFLTPQTQPG